MPTYSYLILTRQGKETKGTLDAGDREDALLELKKTGGVIISLEEVGRLSKDIELSFMDKKPSPRDLAVFCRQFVSILNAGVPAVTALEMLSEQTENKKLAKSLFECKKSIEQGETLARAMSDFPNVFPPMLVTLIAAGEASGSIDVSLTRMAEQFEKSAKIQATIKKATVYPTFLFFLTIVAVALLLTFVVPTFKDVLSDLGVPLPGITVAVLAAADFLQNRWYIALLFVIALVVFFRAFAGTDTGKHFWGRLSLKAPLFGQLTTKTVSALMSRTLSTLIGAGLPLVDALGIVAQTMSNVYFKEALLHARDAVMLGSPLSGEFRRAKIFPPLVYHMTGIGEEAGELEEMLTKLAEYYESESESATERVMAAIEPIIILLMALLVGTIIVSVLMPMASMYSGLNNL